MGEKISIEQTPGQFIPDEPVTVPPSEGEIETFTVLPPGSTFPAVKSRYKGINSNAAEIILRKRKSSFFVFKSPSAS